MQENWLSIVALAIVVAIFGVAAIWNPYVKDILDLEERAAVCEVDLGDARRERDHALAQAVQANLRRDIAAKRWDEWQGWYEEAHADRVRLAAELEAARTQLFQARLAASPPPKVVEIPPPKKKPTRKKRSTMKPRVQQKRVVYDWSWLFGR
jgi:hypothetical protein